MPGYAIEPAGDDLAAVAGIYRDAGFRPDLVDDLRFLRDLDGEIFVCTWNGKVVGASSCLAFVRTGWIGGVAVSQAHRRRGLGRELTEVAQRALAARGVTTSLLHATGMARPLYERMGFRAEAEFLELHGPALPGPAGAAPQVRPGTPNDFAAILDLDRTATGEDRRRLLRALWPQGGLVYDAGTVRGFALRQTAGAAGAVIAAEPDAGEALADAAVTGGGILRVPMPATQKRLRQSLERRGFREALRTTRMHLGPPPEWHADRIFSAFNLYWG